MSEPFTVEAVAGERLDVALGADQRVGSRAAAQKLIDAGAVLVDGVPRAKRHMLRGGESIEVRPPEPPAPDVAGGERVEFEIAYEDDDVIVVDKPAGLVVHPSAGHSEATLIQGLAGRAAGGDDPWRPGVVHRLDKDTSGLLIVAKNDEAHRRLQQALRERQIQREYLGLVDGRPDARTGTIDAPIGRDRRDRTVHSTITDKPREAVTHFQVEEELPRTTLLRVRLETGRTHQIRVHLAAIDLLVSGDAQYGVANDLGLERQFLHASRLAFDHPMTGKRVDVEAPLPPDLQAALERART